MQAWRKAPAYRFECKRPLIEIDNRGQRLRGCMTCNIWWSLIGGGAVKLSVEDLAALHALRTAPPPRRKMMIRDEEANTAFTLSPMPGSCSSKKAGMPIAMTNLD